MRESILGMQIDWDHMSGEEFEKLTARLLRHKGYTDIIVTPKSGDYGIDIIAYKDGRKHGFQCKRYSKAVGIKAVQEAYAGKSHYQCDEVCVVTNNGFSKAAQELAKETGTLLWDGETFKKYLRSSTSTVLQGVAAEYKPIYQRSSYGPYISKNVGGYQEIQLDGERDNHYKKHKRTHSPLWFLYIWIVVFVLLIIAAVIYDTIHDNKKDSKAVLQKIEYTIGNTNE